MLHPFVGMIMMLARVLLLSLFCILQLRRAVVSGALQGRVKVSKSSEDGKEIWGYSEVRKGAHMFWWLYYSTHPGGQNTRPLIIWLQGGPGLSSSGVGNLALLGPLDEELKPRNHTWVKEANVLFVDNPIDTGYSYLDNGTLPAQTGDDIGLDLVNMLNSVNKHLPHLNNLSVYIFGQSYGGKMATAFGCQLQKAIDNNEIAINFKGVALGNAWISPADSVVNWAPLLLHMSIIDQYKFAVADRAAKDLVSAIATCGPLCETSRRKLLILLWIFLSIDVNFYNLLQYNTLSYFENPIIREQMNGTIRQKLHIVPDNVTWQNPSINVRKTAQQNDFLSSEVYRVDWLLERNIEVIIYQGQLDMMCPTNGAQDWLNKLKWKKFPTFYRTQRQPLMAPGEQVPEMFVKAHENLKFYYILKSGHAVPKNTPAAALRMVSYILNNSHTGGAINSHTGGAINSQAHISFASPILIVVQLITFYEISRISS